MDGVCGVCIEGGEGAWTVCGVCAEGGEGAWTVCVEGWIFWGFVE